jgi:hypothetical protein
MFPTTIPIPTMVPTTTPSPIPDNGYEKWWLDFVKEHFPWMLQWL